MGWKFLLLWLFASTALAQQLETVYEKSNGAETPTYSEIVSWWADFARRFPSQVQMREAGPTDAGLPLHLLIISADGTFDLADARKKGKNIVLINNGIHPGEPDGIDASMLLMRDYLFKKKSLPENVVLALIPVYNIGGCLDRSPYYRVDQNGPNAFGSRGNSRNFDLNRDFIKSDALETRSFYEIFHLADPDVMIDNHVSNGADYQHVMTLIATQHNKLGGSLGRFLNDVFEPAVYQAMKQKSLDLIPYVNIYGGKPENGWSQFLDMPRYSTGYAALWQTIGFMPETHMLKEYRDRVNATYELMETLIGLTAKNGQAITRLRQENRRELLKASELDIRWALDSSDVALRNFKGFESGMKTSEVSGLPRLFYDRHKPFEKEIPFYNTFKKTASVSVPEAYLIPRGWWPVIDLLKANQVILRELDRDTTLLVTQYQILDYQTSGRPYEGHYLHSGVQIQRVRKEIPFRKGDWYVPVDQKAKRFLVEVLEPEAPDSYFNWNFFDAILQQKEGFSGYSFEDIAAGYLKATPQLQQKLEEKKRSDTRFAQSARDQLHYIYENSSWQEPAFMRYPVYRVDGE